MVNRPFLTVDSVSGAMPDSVMEKLGVDLGLTGGSTPPPVVVSPIGSLPTVPVHPNGAMAIILDDGWRDAYTVAFPLAQEFGAKLTYAIGSTDSIGAGDYRTREASMTGNELKIMEQAGHEIANHSKNHYNMANLSPQDRLAQWDASKTFLESQVGVGKVRNFIYPNNSTNNEINTEGWLRYDHVLAGNQVSWRQAPNSQPRFYFGRQSWSSGNHSSTVMPLLESVHANKEVGIVYTHNVNDTGTGQITSADLRALLVRAKELGVRVDTLQNLLGVPNILTNPGFENGDMSSWELFRGHTTSQHGDRAADTPQLGLNGAYSYRLQSTILTQDLGFFCTKAIPFFDSNTMTLSGRLRTVSVQGNGACMMVAIYNAAGQVIEYEWSAPLIGTNGWARASIDFSKSGEAAYYKVGGAMNKSTGEAFFDHLHLGKTADGLYG